MKLLAKEKTDLFQARSSSWGKGRAGFYYTGYFISAYQEISDCLFKWQDPGRGWNYSWVSVCCRVGWLHLGTVISFFIVIQTRLENIRISLFPPVTFIKSLSYSVLSSGRNFLRNTTLQIQMLSYVYPSMISFLPSFHRDNHYSEFVVNYFQAILFCSYMHVYECIKYIALFHMLKFLNTHIVL